MTFDTHPLANYIEVHWLAGLARSQLSICEATVKLRRRRYLTQPAADLASLSETEVQLVRDIYHQLYYPFALPIQDRIAVISQSAAHFCEPNSSARLRANCRALAAIDTACDNLGDIAKAMTHYDP